MNYTSEAEKEFGEAIEPAEVLRPRLELRAELTLVLLPTITVLLVLWLVEAFGRRHILFASLASSAFLIYLDPQLKMNRVRTLAISQTVAAVVGSVSFQLLGPGYLAAAVSMVVFILLMVIGDFVHPPAIGTALTFAFRPNANDNLLLFGLAVMLVVILIMLATASTWLVHRYTPQR